MRDSALDALRAWAMLAGVVFHAALAYSPLMQPWFPTADPRAVGPAWLDGPLWLLHLLRMPLFFLLAGYFAAGLVQRGGVSGLMRNRGRRIALPLLIAAPLVHWVLSASTAQAAAQAEHPGAVLRWLRDANISGSAPPSLHHLWFLYYLLLCSLGVWLARALLPAGMAERLKRLPAWALWLVLPLLLTPLFAMVSAPHPAPEGLLPQFWALGLFGAFFAWGYLGAARADWLQPGARGVALLLAGSLLAYALFLVLLRTHQEMTASWPLALLSACVAVWMQPLCVAAARRWLARPSAAARYLADASYWTYLLHLPLLLPLQYRLLDVDLPWGLKLALSVTVTLALCLFSYALIGRRLLGPKPRK